MPATLEEPRVELSEENKRMIQDTVTQAICNAVAQLQADISNTVCIASLKIAKSIHEAEVNQKTE